MSQEDVGYSESYENQHMLLQETREMGTSSRYERFANLTHEKVLPKKRFALSNLLRVIITILSFACIAFFYHVYRVILATLYAIDPDPGASYNMVFGLFSCFILFVVFVVGMNVLLYRKR